MLDDGVESEYNIVDVDGIIVVLALERSPDADFEAFRAQAQTVMDSMAFSSTAQ